MTNLRTVIQPKNTKIRQFLSQIQAFSFPNSKILQLDKFQGSELKYDNIVLKFQFKILKKAILVPNLGIFIPKFRHCHYFTKCSNEINSKVLISNMTIIVSKFQPKNIQIRHFWSQIQAFLFFLKILQLDKFEGTGLKYNNIVFKFQPKNTEIWHFWFQIQIFSFLHEILKCYKVEGVDFKYDNGFLKFQLQNTQIRHFWSQIQTFSLFHKILQLDIFEGADFK